MSRLDIAKLAISVGHNIQIADEVRRDPAVVKAAKQVRDDLATALRSAGELASETQSSWVRHSWPVARP